MHNFVSVVRTVFLLLVVPLALGSALASAADLPPNLVTNWSLEDEVGADGLPHGWESLYPVPTGAYRAMIADGGRTGKKQMRIDYIEGSSQGQFGAMAANRVPFDRAKRYVARGWVKVVGGERATADVKLHYYGPNREYLGQTRIGFASPGNDDWQLVTVTDHATDFPRARSIGLAIACTGDAKAQYDDLELLAFDKEELPVDFEETYGITLSPQQAVLSRRVGTWETKTTFNPCLSFPQGFESTGLETVRWSLGGRLLVGRQETPDSGVEQLSLLAYDARDKVYRSWFFDCTGDLPRCQTIGRWDKATDTITFTNEPKDEFDSLVRMKFVDNDTVHWQGVWKDKAGKILLDIEATARRVRKD